MVITEVRIKLMEDNNENERLQAFCSVTFDDAFVVRDLKIIEGTKGSFVAMPSRKLTDRCNHCGCKNHLRARFCNQCGGKLDEDRATRDADGRVKLHADIAHPINSRLPRGHPGRRAAGLPARAASAPSSPATSAPTTTTTATISRGRRTRRSSTEAPAPPRLPHARLARQPRHHADAGATASREPKKANEFGAGVV